MSEKESTSTGRRDFLQTLVAAPVLGAATLVQTAQAAQAERDVFVKHAYEEHTVNLGEVAMNYVVSGPAGEISRRSMEHRRLEGAGGIARGRRAS